MQHIFTERPSNATGTPSGYPFQVEFIGAFKYIFGSVHKHLYYRVFLEVKQRDDNNRNQRRRVDILLCNNNQQKYGFELVVAANEANFAEYMDHADDYREVHKCERIYLINLTIDHRLTGYYEKEWVREHVTPAHVFFVGGEEGKAYMRYVIRVSIESGTWPTLVDLSPINPSW